MSGVARVKIISSMPDNMSGSPSALFWNFTKNVIWSWKNFTKSWKSEENFVKIFVAAPWYCRPFLSGLRPTGGYLCHIPAAWPFHVFTIWHAKCISFVWDMSLNYLKNLYWFGYLYMSGVASVKIISSVPDNMSGSPSALFWNFTKNVVIWSWKNFTKSWKSEENFVKNFVAAPWYCRPFLSGIRDWIRCMA